MSLRPSAAPSFAPAVSVAAAVPLTVSGIRCLGPAMPGTHLTVWAAEVAFGESILTIEAPQVPGMPDPTADTFAALLVKRAMRALEAALCLPRPAAPEPVAPPLSTPS